jgi:hypothetical protein
MESKAKTEPISAGHDAAGKHQKEQQQNYSAANPSTRGSSTEAKPSLQEIEDEIKEGHLQQA